MPWVRQSTLDALRSSAVAWEQTSKAWQNACQGWREEAEGNRVSSVVLREISRRIGTVPMLTVEALRMAPPSVVLNAIELPQPLSIDAANRQRMAQLREREKA